MKYFIVERDRKRANSTWCEFSDRAQALKALSDKEAAREPHVEIVLLRAASLDELRVTHGRYFMGAKELISRTSGNLKGLTDQLREARSKLSA